MKLCIFYEPCETLEQVSLFMSTTYFLQMKMQSYAVHKLKYHTQFASRVVTCNNLVYISVEPFWNNKRRLKPFFSPRALPNFEASKILHVK